MGQIGPGEYFSTLQSHDHQPIDLLATSRFFVALVNTAALMLSFFFARRLTGFLPAFVGFLLIALNPFHVAHSHLLHLDGMLSCFMLLSLLAFLNYLSDHRCFDLIVSGIAAGSSWLTKSPGFFLIPVIGLLALIDLWRNSSAWKGSRLINSVRQCAWPLIVWAAAGIVVFVIVWPAMWVDPRGTLVQILDSALVDYADKGHVNPDFFNGMVISDGKLDASHFYPITYLWRSTPVVLAGLVAATVAFVARCRPLDQTKTRRTTVAFVLFAVVFTISVTLSSTKSDRYLLPIYAPLDLVAAMGWVAIADWSKRLFFSTPKSHLASMILGSAIVLQAIGTFRVFPYYLSYYNPLMGGSTKALEVMRIGWGEGLEQAAHYLNRKPNAHELRVAAWYSPSFSYFFSGRSRDIPTQVSDDQLHELLDSDYAVIYVNQWQRQIPQPLLDHLAQQMPEHSIWINGLEYVRIYKLSSGWRSLMDSNPDWDQDLLELRDYMEARGLDRVYFSWFGDALPEQYGVHYVPLPSWPLFAEEPWHRVYHPQRPGPGTYAISATHLQGDYLPDPDTYAWFREREPIAKIGHSLFIYDVPHMGGEAVSVCLSGVSIDQIDVQTFDTAFGTNDLDFRWFDARHALVLPAGRHDAWYLLADAVPPDPALWERFFASTTAWGQRQTRDDGRPYTLYRLTADDLARLAAPTPLGEMPVWWSPAVAFPPGYERHPLSLPVNIDRHLAFLGYELANARLGPGDELQLLTFWRVERPLEPPLALFVHLLDAGGQVRSQHDGLSVDPVGMRSGDIFVQGHRFPTPSDMPLGEYQLEVGVYRPNTMQRWSVYKDADAVADRLLLHPVSMAVK
jgi:hypothetical protein